MFKFPWSAVSAIIYIYALILIYFLTRSHPGLKRLYSGKTCIISIAVATSLIVFFGFTAFHRNWLYYVVMLVLVSTMGLDLLDNLMHFRQRKPAMTFAHLSVFIVLTAGLFGSGDKRSAFLEAHLDEPVSEAVDEYGQVVHLPFILTLNSFTIDQYPPEVKISASDGIENAGEEWCITTLKTLDKALPLDGGFREMDHTGAEPAALVRAENRRTGWSVEGWVSCGSYIFNPVTLSLPDGCQVYMPRPLPKKFESKVKAIDSKGRNYDFDIAVNHPVRIGSWNIYQADYDVERGRWSTLSVLQCVYDPWFPIIRVGLWMILASALIMFVTAGSGAKKGKK